jgi:hypothetical protein
MPLENNECLFNKLKESLPLVFSRKEAAKHLGGILKAATLRNLDMRGKGPKVKARIGKKVAYERDDFIDWLQQYHGA